MKIDKFLSFWSHYNTAIIEGLIASIILLSLYLAYRSFFGKKTFEEASGGTAHLDPEQLEKVLEKALKNQMSGVTFVGGTGGGDGGAQAAAAQAAAAQAQAEATGLRTTLEENNKKLEALQAELATTQQKLAEGGGGGGGAADPEAGKKLADLEARLSEYEVISEDIADLARFREENEKLKKEVENLKVKAAAAPAPSNVTVAAAPAAAPAEPEMSPAEAALIDDELMKEFAAAVENQKGEGGAKPPDQMGSPEGDNANLINEFENFVTKKG